MLGAVLAAGRLLAEVAAVLEEADFYRPAHRAIWRAMLRLADRGQPTDPVTVLGELDDSGELADVGGGPFLHTLVEAVPTVANAGHYAQPGRRDGPAPAGDRPRHPPGPLRRRPGRAGPPGRRAGRHHHRRHGGRGWEPPVPFGAAGEVPAFPVEVLPGWLGEYVAAVATATQTPPDLAGMLALAVLATVAAGAVEVEPRPGWREPLCLFVAVGMDAGTRKSSVFTALTRPVAEFERDQAAAALPGDHRDRHPAPHRRPGRRPRRGRRQQGPGQTSRRSARPRRSPGPPRPPTWSCRRCRGGWSMTPPPRPWPGCWPPTAASPCCQPEGDVFDQMAGRYNQAAGPNLGVYLKGHAGDLLKVDRRGRPPEYVERPCLTIGLAVQPEVLRGLAGRPGFGGRGLLARFLYSLPESLVGRRQAGAPPVPPAVADRYALELQALAASLTAPAGDDGPALLTLDQAGGRAAARLRARPGAPAGRRQRRPGPPGRLGGQARRRHLPPRRPPAPGRPPARRLGPADRRRHLRRRRPAGRLPGRARPGGVRPDGRRPPRRRRPLAAGLDQPHRPGPVHPPRRPPGRPRGRFPKATDLDPALALLEEHGYLRRVDADPSGPKGGRPPSPRFLVNPLHPPQNPHNPQNLTRRPVLWVLWVLWRVATPRGAADERQSRLSRYPTRTAPAAFRPCPHPEPGCRGAQRPLERRDGHPAVQIRRQE